MLSLARAAARAPLRGCGAATAVAVQRTRSFASAAHSASRDLYQVLGVSREATPAAIKIAYYRAVKKAHPDVQGSHDEFVELVRAYEVLSDRNLRARYDAQLRVAQMTGQHVPGHGPGYTGPYRSHYGPSGGADAANDEEDSESDRRFRPYRPGDASADDYLLTLRRGMGLFQSIRYEFEQALSMALEGPQVPDFEQEGLKMVLPWAFEAEIRTDPTHPHVLELVSGRQLLGFVRSPTNPRLPPIGNAERIGSAEEHELELVFQDKVIATAVRSKDTIQFMDENRVHLAELSLQERGAEALVKKLWKSFEMPSFSTHIPTPEPAVNPLLPRYGKPQVFDLWRGGATELSDGAGSERASFRLVQFRSPGVSYAYYFHGWKLPDKDFEQARCEARVQMAWLPPSNWWLVPPRSEAHDRGGWYFEFARPAIDEDHILALAQKVLEEEHLAPPEYALTRKTRLQWAIEHAAALKRASMGALDSRVPVLLAAFATL